MTLSKVLLTFAAGTGICFVGYCFYFDYRRRSAPDFPEKLRRKRALEKAKNEYVGLENLPDLNDHAALQAFFMEELQKGENEISQGEHETGIQHLANALSVASNPSSFFTILKHTLSSDLFKLLVERTKKTQEKIFHVNVTTSIGDKAFLDDDALE